MRDKIIKMGALAKLSFFEDELEEAMLKFQRTLDYIEDLQEVDTEGVEPLYRVFEYSQVLREDNEEESLPREQVLMNTVESEYGFFKLINIIDKEVE